jgi:hypothetical protein
MLIKYASRMCQKLLFLPLLANSNFVFTNIDNFFVYYLHGSCLYAIYLHVGQ